RSPAWPASVRCCSCASTSSSASGSSSSRSSSWPSSSRSRSRSRASGAPPHAAKQPARGGATRSHPPPPPLGVRRIPLVHVGGDVVEEQRGGEGRGGRRLDLDQAELARVQIGEDLAQRGQVEHVAQALAVGLQDDREAGKVARHLEQALRLE